MVREKFGNYPPTTRKVYNPLNKLVRRIITFMKNSVIVLLVASIVGLGIYVPEVIRANSINITNIILIIVLLFIAVMCGVVLGKTDREEKQKEKARNAKLDAIISKLGITDKDI